MFKQFAASLAVTIALLAAPLAHADEYLYSVHDDLHGMPYGDDFTYLSPILITTTTTFTPDTYEVNRHGVVLPTPTDFSVTIEPDLDGGELAISTAPYFSGGIGPLGAGLVTVGHVSLFNGEFTFDITDVPSAVPPTVTPEPSSLALLGTGLLGAAGAARRKFNVYQ